MARQWVILPASHCNLLVKRLNLLILHMYRLLILDKLSFIIKYKYYNSMPK